MKTPQFIAEREVLCCASSLISTIAQGSPGQPLVEQAYALYENSDTDEREILEHWIVSDWLAKKLLEQGETVDEDFADLAIWGRKTHGQAIELDDVMQDICDAINRR